MNNAWHELIGGLNTSCALTDTQRRSFQRACEAIVDASADDIAELLSALVRRGRDDTHRDSPLIEPLLAQIVLWQRQSRERIDERTRRLIVLLYNNLGDSSPDRWRLLQLLATAAARDDLQAFAKLIVTSPPQPVRAAALAMVPLFQTPPADPAALFPDLLRGLEHVGLAAPILDLTNFLTRSGLVAHHPAADRSPELIALLGNLVQRLACIEDSARVAATSSSAVEEQIDEGVAVIVGLCDALAWIGDERAIGKLYQALELGHRRVRTEAAAALARLGESHGIDALVSLAAEPVARLRVLATAEELGIQCRIDPQFSTPTARAESSVALELSQPGYFGLPPTQLELIDARTQYWPGCPDPVDCYLFRYTYRLGDAEYSNIAVAGPLVHALVANLSDLPPDDIYAAYAGWDVEDASIFAVPVDEPTHPLRIEAERFVRRLRDEGYSDFREVQIGHFFGERFLVARARRDAREGTVVADLQSVHWYPAQTHRHPIGPQDAFYIYTGRRLLRFFNS